MDARGVGFLSRGGAGEAGCASGDARGTRTAGSGVRGGCRDSRHHGGRDATARRIGAGGRNRTDDTSLEERSFTTKLHPQGRVASFAVGPMRSSLGSPCGGSHRGKTSGRRSVILVPRWRRREAGAEGATKSPADGAAFGEATRLLWRRSLGRRMEAEKTHVLFTGCCRKWDCSFSGTALASSSWL